MKRDERISCQMGGLLRTTAFALAALSCFGVTAQTASPSPLPAAAVNLAPVVVSGSLPGPALWKVSKGGHVMWVLGTTSPLPRGMRWKSAKVEKLIASSQEVLQPPSVSIGAQAGFWGQLWLIPSIIGLKKLPKGETLQQVLSPELYSRWQVQRKKYLGWFSGNRLRPMFAGEKLYDAAVKHSGLTNDNVVESIVDAAAKRDKVPLVDTGYFFVVKDPHGAARKFKQSAVEDQACLSDTLDAIEHNLAQATARANAWATGDLQALSKVLPGRQDSVCLAKFGNTPFAKSIGVTGISEHVRQAWIKTAKDALSKYPQTMALLPMKLILPASGYLQALQADGYVVESPN